MLPQRKTRISLRKQPSPAKVAELLGYLAALDYDGYMEAREAIIRIYCKYTASPTCDRHPDGDAA